MLGQLHPVKPTAHKAYKKHVAKIAEQEAYLIPLG